MKIELDHLIIPSHQKEKSAELISRIFNVPWSNSNSGPFCAVYMNEGLTLDFDQAESEFPVQHYCFRVSETNFDGIQKRIDALGIAYRGSPHGENDQKIGRYNGGRLLYWNEPDHHVWEILTVSYARQ